MTTRPKGALCDKDLKNRPRLSGFVNREVKGISNNDGYGYENVTQNVNSRCFKLYPAYSISFNSSNVSDFFWS